MRTEYRRAVKKAYFFLVLNWFSAATVTVYG